MANPRQLPLGRKTYPYEPNDTVHVTTARLRSLLNVNGHGEEAARDGERWAASERGWETT